MFKNALVSTANKEGLVDLIQPLANQGMRVVSTGGTAKLLRQAGIQVIEVKEQTACAEVMDGRVKSLHPRIHIPLLARDKDQNVLDQEGLSRFDLLVCNLYPFEQKAQERNHQGKQKTIHELIEWIDVGGPTLLRAGAKNFKHVTVVCDPSDYTDILKNGRPDLEKRKQLAGKAFALLSRYNACIAEQMTEKSWKKNGDFYLSGQFIKSLRYGENPGQQAGWFQLQKEGLHSAKIHQGKELSFNNLRDLESAVNVVRSFREPCCVAIKHTNPCGVACDLSMDLAVNKALKADPISVFGGVVAVNQPIHQKIADHLCSIFLEAVIAPSYSPDALSVFKKKKNLRILEWPNLIQTEQPITETASVHSIAGGFLVQETTPYIIHSWPKDWKIIGSTPSAAVKTDLLLAWKISAHLKSNAIALAAENQTVGLGMGQVSRIRAIEQAISAWKKLHPSITSPVMASDGFFPFSDSVTLAAAAGIRWIIQPGGSIRDTEIFTTAKKLAVNIILTGKRCFSH